MHAPEWVARRVVLKFRDATDGLPTQRGMAVFARNVKRAAVGIPSNWLLSRRTGVLGVDLRSKEKDRES